ncbi:auxin-responsive protein SAUR15-like [Olea europaea var. sylvestris]|uniref:auxin-responsive protein SAUR15-like n=1 Tax=Olea europaea var. sylvestris TaxID=158386 RepID=UPI000C1D3D86|nr:auxin-responsive protein SAUR15-like [Olea europaea var. sylvestris]XP_022868910.1 auxin-responsive protein SAUR15-like [Olea europaea var. sylvestris]
MLGKKIGSMKKLAKKIKVVGNECRDPSKNECLLRDNYEGGGSPSSTKTPPGTFAVYVGEERQRFMVPTGYLSHPLFKMLLEKAYNEFGFEQRNGLVVPCSVPAFQEVVSAVECCNGKFHFGDMVEEFI